MDQFVLGYSRPLSTALQVVDCNLLKVHENAPALVRIYLQELRNSLLFKRVVTIAEELGVAPQKPRTAGRQVHRTNSGNNYYWLIIFIPFVDHVLQHLNDRFPQQLMPVMMALYLIPSNVSSPNDECVQSNKLEYEGDLPSEMTLEQEIDRWRKHVPNKWKRQYQSINRCSGFGFYHGTVSEHFHNFMIVTIVACWLVLLHVNGHSVQRDGWKQGSAAPWARQGSVASHWWIFIIKAMLVTSTLIMFYADSINRTLAYWQNIRRLISSISVTCHLCIHLHYDWLQIFV